MSVSATARVAAPSAVRPSGWWGMVLVIATEATLFALLLAAYYYLRFQSHGDWPPGGLHDPRLVKPLIATIILALSSAPLAMAARAAVRREPVVARAALLVGIALGIAFLVFQLTLVQTSLKTFGPRDSAYGSIYYTLIGLHAAHVVAGVLLAVWALLRSLRFDRAGLITIRVTALYWHFVNVVAVVVYLTLYLSPRI